MPGSIQCAEHHLVCDDTVLSRGRNVLCTGSRSWIFSLREWFSTVVSSDTVFVTLFPTTVETVKDNRVLAILTFYRVGGHVSLCDSSSSSIP